MTVGEMKSWLESIKDDDEEIVIVDNAYGIPPTYDIQDVGVHEHKHCIYIVTAE